MFIIICPFVERQKKVKKISNLHTMIKLPKILRHKSDLLHDLDESLKVLANTFDINKDNFDFDFQASLVTRYLYF